MPRRKRMNEDTSIPLEGKTLPELITLLSQSGYFYCTNGPRYFSLNRYNSRRFYGTVKYAGEGSDAFSLTEEELLNELKLWRYQKL